MIRMLSFWAGVGGLIIATVMIIATDIRIETTEGNETVEIQQNSSDESNQGIGGCGEDQC